VENSVYSEYRELIDKSLVLEVYISTIHRNREKIPHHWHMEPEIIKVEKGSVCVFVNNNEVYLSEGDIYYINSAIIHSFTIEPDSTFYAIVFDYNCITSVHNDSCDNNYFLPLRNNKSFIDLSHISSKEKTEITKVIDEIININHLKTTGYDLKFKVQLLRLFECFLNFNLLTDLSREKYNKEITNYESLKKTLVYINENCSSEISINKLAEMSYVSPNYFCKFFKAKMGVTPIEYINQKRINDATVLLQSTNYKVLDIAMMTGFQNFSYFSKMFKKMKNLSPSDYRRFLK
jgi:YesN/AraC family two-component response regulator